MAISRATPPRETNSGLRLIQVGNFPGTRVLAWDGDVLYSARGYELIRSRPADIADTKIEWETVGRFSPVWWRTLTSASRLGFRLVRDGFHALAVLPSGELIVAVPGAIATLAPGEKEFRITHRLQRGTRPLNITAMPDGHVFWGEYFDNPERDEVYVYGSEDRGTSWKIVHVFTRNSIRHVHNIVHDRWADCLWVLTGDIGEECRVLRVSPDWSRIETVMSGSQQVRAVAAVPMAEGLYFASDTPVEQNYIYKLNCEKNDRQGSLTRLSEINASVLCGCAVGDAIFFTTMIEPSAVNLDQSVGLYGSSGGASWQRLGSWQKDLWPMKFFQYGNAFLPTGKNTTNLLAITTIAVKGHDLETSLWRVERALNSPEPLKP
jgi:hypothetical protein